MADTGAPHFIPFADPTDLVRDWPALSEDVADAVAAGLDAAGGLVAVKSAIFTGTQTASVTAGNNVAVTDLTITHEVADASNKLVILAMLGVAANSALRGQTSLAVHDGTNLIGAGAVASNRTSLTAGGTPSSGTGNFVAIGRAATFVHTPGAGSKTYTVRAVNQSQFTNTVFVNRNEADTDNGDSPRGASSLVIMEV